MNKFYCFDQNNSGGVFDHYEDKGIGYQVWVEAESPSQANDRAESIGLYFYGCNDGVDCPCCGDRWYPASDYVSHDNIHNITGGWGVPSYIHYIDGRVEKVEPVKGT